MEEEGGGGDRTSKGDEGEEEMTVRLVGSGCRLEAGATRGGRMEKEDETGELVDSPFDDDGCKEEREVGEVEEVEGVEEEAKAAWSS
jgi:hypothetical protein